MTQRFLILLGISIVHFAQPLFGQTDPCMHRIVPVSVLSSDGRLVAGLQADNFRASLRGTAVQILSVTPDSRPRRVIIVLDASGSMVYKPALWYVYLLATQELAANLPQGTLTGLVVFATELKTVLPFTNDPRKVQDLLASMGSEAGDPHAGNTSLYDSVRRAAALFDAPEEGDVIYAVTDEGNNEKKRSLSDLESELVSRGIRLFSFSILTPIDSTLQAANAGRIEFQEIVRTTGGLGVVFSTRRVDEKAPLIDRWGRTTELALEIHTQAEMISSFYRMDVRFAAPLTGSAGWKLQLKSADLHDPTVLYPQKFSACTSPPPTH